MGKKLSERSTIESFLIKPPNYAVEHPAPAILAFQADFLAPFLNFWQPACQGTASAAEA